ncbi:hypothetical protein C2869_19450 [Saccharobesus litoralis]|uniref:tRNA(Met) cytidine acetyltransferase TmcA n=1 Tax=Saccharobesus litoralis TaxID=2172099 RepID=A0A2S0VW50_9ALTE|nr:GNAT family N-acetyltransferase [Saccharobesus litoralis]AWB68447.1 hypothetical protein C2869_19450 [Saccharobesus litoralis]
MTTELQQLHQQLKLCGFRLPLLVTGEETQVNQLANELLISIQTHQNLNSILAVNSLTSFTPQANTTRISSNKFRHYLGHEFDCVLINGWQGFHVDAFAALSGTVKAGGLFILLMPELVSTSESELSAHKKGWDSFADPDRQRFLQWGVNSQDFKSNFLTFAQKYLLQSFIQIISQTTPILGNNHQQQVSIPERFKLGIPSLKSNFQLPGSITADQQNIIEQIHDSIAQDTGNNQQHFIIAANRGRGKSATLGMLAAQLVRKCKSHKPLTVGVTAPRMDCANQIQTWFQQKHPSEHELSFYALDVLAINKPQLDVLLVDEAAAIPVELLQQLTRQYKHVVFATTEHGYEGCGRGFTIRFKKWLARHFTQQSFRLINPIRWSPNDPLEECVNQLLLLDAEPAPSLKALSMSANSITTAWFSQQDMLQQTDLLRQAFGLLVQAHYRTTPSDLRYMLDCPTMRTVLMKSGNQVVGVALISLEGDLPSDLAQQVARGQRRPNGHLFAQTIAAQTGFYEFATLKGWRIVRIAIHPDMQHRGLGSQLLAFIDTACQQEKQDYLSTSFGLTLPLLKFWQKNQFSLVRLGQTPEASTGEYSAAMLRCISVTSDNYIAELRPIQLLDVQQQLTHRYVNLSLELKTALGKILANSAKMTMTTSRASQLAENFAQYHATLASCRLAIVKLINDQQCQQHFPLLTLATDPTIDHDQLILQFRLSGKKQLIRKLRSLTGELLNQIRPKN